MKTESIQSVVIAIDPVNVDHIMQDENVMGHFRWCSRQVRHNKKAAVHWFRVAKQEVSRFHERCLTPETIKVGDGVTINLWSDRYAGTVIRVTKSMVIVQRDKATLDQNFKPEFEIGGFAAHCTNQNEQSYSYRPDPDGEIYKFHWSKKYRRYGQPGNLTLSKGRHEFYDYNF